LREIEAPTFSDIRLIDGGKVVSPTRQPLFTPRKIPGTHFRENVLKRDRKEKNKKNSTRKIE
jgi:hypothetical protein